MGGLVVLALIGLYFFLATKVFKAAKTTSAKVIAVLLILLIPTADAIYGRIKLQQMCAAEAGLKVYRVAEHVEGFMGDYADEEMITKYGYQFVESCDAARSCYKFSKKDDGVVKEYNVTPKSEYRLRTVYLDYNPSIIDEKKSYDRIQDLIEVIATGEILATDTSIHFHGGWIEQLLAMTAGVSQPTVASCPEGSAYRDKYALITNTLKHSGE